MPAITIQQLNEAALDADHIEAVATSLLEEVADRFGNNKITMSGASSRMLGQVTTVTNYGIVSQGQMDTKVAEVELYKVATNQLMADKANSIIGITVRGDWATGTAYAVKDVFLYSGTWYVTVIAHTSSVSFASDASNVRVYQGVTLADLSPTNGATKIGFQQGGVGAVPRTLDGKVKESISVKDFGAVGDGVADDTAEIQSAQTAAGLNLVNFTAGDYLTSTTANVSYTGSGTVSKLDGSPAYNFTKLGNVGADNNKKAKIQYGTIRQTTDAGGWSFVNDATHQYAGFTDAITVVSGNLVVPFNSTSVKVGTFVAVPDETFAALGLELGASVGLSSATISLYKPLYATVDLATLVCTPSPFFTGTVSAVNNGNGTVTITHPTVGATGALATVDNKTKHKTTLTSSTATSTTIESIVEFGGNIFYNGTNWVVNTPTYLKPTMVFSAGVLTVTHNIFGAADANVVVTPRDSATTLCATGNATSTNFTVVFRDYTGALITTPTTDMGFFYQGTQMMTRETPLGQILLTRNHCKLDANNFFAASGNIWLMGASNV